MHKNECSCEKCKKRELLQKKYPGKTIGMQYASMKLTEDLFLLVSAEEIAYLTDYSVMALAEDSEANSDNYTVAYGVFTSQINWHDDFYDLVLAKGATYFYLDDFEGELRKVEVVDYFVISKKENRAKVCLLLKSTTEISFPEDNTQLAVTLTKMMPELGTKLKDLVFSRIEHGIFRIDQGIMVDYKKSSDWKKYIDESKFFEIEYDRLLFIDESEDVL